MVILCKGNKSDYSVAKAYHPIRLLNTLGKGFNTLISHYILYLCEKCNLLPPSQFGGRPRHNTSSTILLITSHIKDAWWKGNVVAGLFFDVQGPKHSEGHAHPSHEAMPHPRVPRLNSNTNAY